MSEKRVVAAEAGGDRDAVEAAEVFGGSGDGGGRLTGEGDISDEGDGAERGCGLLAAGGVSADDGDPRALVGQLTCGR